MKLSWDWLRLVLAIVNGKGLSGAAKALGVHHSTVLRQLDTLEHQTGVVLFDRKATGYTPTEEGISLANKARVISAGVEEAYRQLEEKDLRISGTIRIATSDFLGQMFLTKALSVLSHRYPDITTEVVVSSQFASLGKRDADVALRAITQVPKGLKGKCLTTLSYAVYAHKSFISEFYGLESKPYDLTCADLTKARWVTDDDTMIHSQLHHWLNVIISKPKVALRANSTMVKFHAVKQGIGIALLPTLLAESDDDLICIYSDPLWTLDLWFLSHSDLYNMQRIQALEASFVDIK